MSSSAQRIAVIGAVQANRKRDIVGDVAFSVRLDSTDEKALRSQEVDRVDVVVVAIGENFEAALLTTVIRKKNLAVPKVICRAQTPFHAQIFGQIGADEVIEPEQDAGRMLGRRLAHPRINDYIKLGDGFTVVEMFAPRKFVDRSVKEINLRSSFQVNLIGIRRHADNPDTAVMISVPGPDDGIEEGDILLLVGSDDSLARLQALSD